MVSSPLSADRQVCDRLNYSHHEYQYGDLVLIEVDESLLVGRAEARKQVSARCRPLFVAASYAYVFIFQIGVSIFDPIRLWI